MTVEPAVMMLLEEIRQRVVAQSVLLIAIFLMLTAALLALLMKCLYRRLEALITEIMVKAAQQTQQNPQETQFPKEDGVISIPSSPLWLLFLRK